MQTNYEYYTKNPEIVMKIINKLANLTIDEMDKNTIIPLPDKPNSWEMIIGLINEREHIDRSLIKEMTYKELAAIIYSIGGNEKYEDSYNEQLFDYYLIYTLFKTSTLSLINRFMSMPMFCFKKAVEFKNNLDDNSFALAKDAEGVARMTVREYLDKSFADVNRIFIPIGDANAYIQKVKKGYAGLGRTLITDFYRIFVDDCTYESVIEKYSTETSYLDEEEDYDYGYDDEEIFD